MLESRKQLIQIGQTFDYGDETVCIEQLFNYELDFYRQCNRRTLEHARNVCGGLDEEGINQEAWHRVYVANPTIPRRAVVRFVCKTISRIAYDQRKKMLPTIPLTCDPIADVRRPMTRDPRLDAIREEERHLSPRQKVVVELYLKGLTVSEIAQRLGLTPAAVRMRLQAARMFLRRRLSE